MDTQGPSTHRDRASELETLIQSALPDLLSFIRSADQELRDHQLHPQCPSSTPTSLVNYQSPEALTALLSETLTLPHQHHHPADGSQKLFESLHQILKYSVNTTSPGFLDKLYHAPLPAGVLAELVLAFLNTNVHVYQTSPVLTVIEKHTTRQLAELFGFTGPRAGGINVQGGSQSNTTSIVIARNTLYPATKIYGNSHHGLNLCLFTSKHGHYSIEKAAQQCGFGSENVLAVPVDRVTGQMDPKELVKLILQVKSQGRTPFYVNATAGTTVLGSFDHFGKIAEVARRYNMWMHVDGAWGGSFVFSEKLKAEKLKGVELADSIAINPHKMMGVPVTCSFLLAKDLRQFHRANTLPAGYLFHGDNGEEDDDDNAVEDTNGEFVQNRVDGHNGISPSTLENGHASTSADQPLTNHVFTDPDEPPPEEQEWSSPNDLADLTLQCGRRGDALKLFFAWQYHGTSYFSQKIETAYYNTTAYFADLIARHENFVLVSQNPPPCLQVCFYYAPGREMVYGPPDASDLPDPSTMTGLENMKSSWTEARRRGKEIARTGKRNSKVTEIIASRLLSRGFMVDFAPALEGKEWMGKFFRAVVNLETTRGTVERLVFEIDRVGSEVCREFKG